MRNKIIQLIKEFYKNIPEVYNSEYFDLNIDMYITDDRVAVYTDKDGHITDIGLARTINTLEEADNTFLHIEGGSLLAIDFLQLTTRQGTDWLWEQMMDRFPHVKITTFTRLIKGDNRLHLMSLDKAKKLLNLLGDK